MRNIKYLKQEVHYLKQEVYYQKQEVYYQKQEVHYQKQEHHKHIVQSLQELMSSLNHLKKTEYPTTLSQVYTPHYGSYESSRTSSYSEHNRYPAVPPLSNEEGDASSSVMHTITNALKGVDPVPVVGVSGGMGALFLLFRYTPVGAFFRGGRGRVHRIPIKTFRPGLSPYPQAFATHDSSVKQELTDVSSFSQKSEPQKEDEGFMANMRNTITGVLGEVDPVPVVGVSGGMGALFLLFRYTPVGAFFRGGRGRVHRIPRSFNGPFPGGFPGFEEYESGYIGYGPMNPLAE
ncbi:hypothetical protein PVT01_000094900 [Plasmodium vivax]|uniref:VIR protein n=1 Tax=Plasmodium vivax TaxID=5855 RepID=A0A1G4E3Q8_PLAVI|nr:hypothetical protein PVT01_000094900 [Plasmodium vivax]